MHAIMCVFVRVYVCMCTYISYVYIGQHMIHVFPPKIQILLRFIRLPLKHICFLYGVFVEMFWSRYLLLSQQLVSLHLFS